MYVTTYKRRVTQMYKMANSGQIRILFVYLLLLSIQTCSFVQCASALFKLSASGMYSE